MPAVDLLLPFLVATVLLSFTPGPGMLYTAAQTIGRGKKSGFYAAIGLHLGSYAHITAAAFGLSLLLATVPVVYTIVKLVGAAYLVWLGIKFFTSELPPSITSNKNSRGTHISALRESAVVEFLNPKSALFFIAFLPQFTDPAAAFPIWLQILVLGIIVNCIFSVTDVACVLLSSRVAQFFQASHLARHWLRRLGGTILAGLGVKLAISELG